MADKLVTFEGKTHAFPNDFTDADISAALGAIPAANASASPKAKTWTPSPSGALALATTGKAVAPTAQALAEFGTNPGVAKTAATAGRVVGGLTSLPAGLSGFGSVQKGAYAGGKAGYFTGKMAQDMARPVSTALEKLAPYAQALSTASGAQGALDLAQMAEPDRKDIGFLGVGSGDPGDPNHPALLNLIATKIGEAVKSLVSKGMSEKEAVRTVLNLKAKGR